MAVSSASCKLSYVKVQFRVVRAVYCSYSSSKGGQPLGASHPLNKVSIMLCLELEDGVNVLGGDLGSTG